MTTMTIALQNTVILTDHVVPGHTVATTPANKCVVTPLIHNLAAKSAAGVLGPDRHSETTA